MNAPTPSTSGWPRRNPSHTQTMHDARTHGHISAESSSETFRHTQVSGTETRPVNPAQNTDHEGVTTWYHWRHVVAICFLSLLSVWSFLSFWSVILQIVSSAFLEVSFRWWWWIQIDLNFFCKIFCWQCASCRKLDAGNVWRRRLYKWRSRSGDNPVFGFPKF
jgi:hypothetical protein